MTTKKITLEHVTKVEGHAEVDISIKDGKVEKAHVHSVEGARYFEGLIKGRKYDEVTMITSRICGICSCGHTIASITAVEKAFDLKPTTQTLLLRELITIAERIRSHASHLYFFVLPDFVGHSSAIEMAKDFGPQVKDCLEIVSTGNELIKLLAGRDMHPFVPVVGGFTKIPEQKLFDEIKVKLNSILPAVERTIKLFSTLDVPKYSKADTVFVSLDNHKSFPLHNGDIITNTGLKFDKDNYEEYIKEDFENGSTAYFARLNDKEYSTGALARVNNSLNKLSKGTKKIMKELKIDCFPSTNLFDQNMAQALETLHWTQRAIEILDQHTFVHEEIIKPKLGTKESYRGIGAIEVPRGILFHDYTFNKEGFITNARIMTPTVQNLPDMEANVKEYLNQVITQDPYKDKDKLKLEIEKMIRAFDPCFSCSTHFLQVNWKEE